MATDWYLERRDRVRRREHLHGRYFADLADAFIAHANQVREVSEGQRRQYKWKWALLKPQFDDVKVTDVETKFLLSLRETMSQKKTPCRNFWPSAATPGKSFQRRARSSILLGREACQIST